MSRASVLLRALSGVSTGTVKTASEESRLQQVLNTPINLRPPLDPDAPNQVRGVTGLGGAALAALLSRGTRLGGPAGAVGGGLAGYLAGDLIDHVRNRKYIQEREERALVRAQHGVKEANLLDIMMRRSAALDRLRERVMERTLLQRVATSAVPGGAIGSLTGAVGADSGERLDGAMRGGLAGAALGSLGGLAAERSLIPGMRRQFQIRDGNVIPLNPKAEPSIHDLHANKQLLDGLAFAGAYGGGGFAGSTAKKKAKEKTAAIFGANEPDTVLIREQIPYEQRRKAYEGFLAEKANEKPTGYGTALGVGGLAGGALGSLTTRNPLVGAAIGALGGGGLGALMARADRIRIADAKRQLESGDIDGIIANRIDDYLVAGTRARDHVAERRHREMMAALEGRRARLPSGDLRNQPAGGEPQFWRDI